MIFLMSSPYFTRFFPICLSTPTLCFLFFFSHYDNSQCPAVWHSSGLQMQVSGSSSIRVTPLKTLVARRLWLKLGAQTHAQFLISRSAQIVLYLQDSSESPICGVQVFLVLQHFNLVLCSYLYHVMNLAMIVGLQMVVFFDCFFLINWENNNMTDQSSCSPTYLD